MKIILIYFLLVFQALYSHAQKEDYIWIMGMGDPFPDSTAKLNYIDFKDDTFAVQLLIKDNPMFGANSVVSDSMGNLLAYTNDINIYNRYHNPILNGTGFQSITQYPSGFPLDQSVLILPLPDTTLHIMIDATYEDIVIDVIVKKLRYSILDLSFNNFQGKVLQKNVTIPNSQDTLNIGFINAVRHANGHDWWVMVTKFGTNIHRKYLITKEGIQFDHDQPIGDLVENGVGFGAFSPDGRWYARYIAYGNTLDPKGKMYLYAFDRCTGQLSTPVSRTYPSSGVYGGCVFSPNAQFLYISKGSYIYQYDLKAPDPLGTELVVATYDGFTDANGLPTYFYAFQLAPDGKLYGIINGFNSHYLHVIDQPNLPGDSCQVLQHAIYLPAYNFGTIPNLPNYRLGAYDGICDSMGSQIPVLYSNTYGKMIQTWPNPVVDILYLSIEVPNTALVDVQVFDLAGRSVLALKNLVLNPDASINLGELPQGVYYYLITEAGKPIKQGKLIKME